MLRVDTEVIFFTKTKKTMATKKKAAEKTTKSKADKEKAAKKKADKAAKKALADAEKQAAEEAKEIAAKTTKELNNVSFTVVYPFVIGPAQGNELQLSLRALEKHLSEENYNVVIIGDKPNFELSDKVIFIEQKHIENASVDFYHKRQTLLEHEAVADTILMMYDDIYLINNVSLDDFKEPIAVGLLKTKEQSLNRWGNHKNLTREALVKEGKDKWNFSSHSPKVYSKVLIRELHENVPMEDMYIFEDYYFNVNTPADFLPRITKGRDIKIGVYRPNPNWKLVDELSKTALFLNNSPSGWTTTLSDYLNARYNEKSTFEL
jgi:ribosomal protein S25